MHPLRGVDVGVGEVFESLCGSREILPIVTRVVPPAVDVHPRDPIDHLAIVERRVDKVRGEDRATPLPCLDPSR